MANLIDFINDESMSTLNPLVKMAVIHYQFESIHPFYDGNGRTGRVLNLLYLALQSKLNLPVLYLSRYIISTKSEYYRLLQAVREHDVWEEWILYILKGITVIAKQSIELIYKIKKLVADFKHKIRKQFPKMYSQDLINALFKHPYTKIDFLSRDLQCHRDTATKYLKRLVIAGFLDEVRLGRSNYYRNAQLVECLMSMSDQ